VETTGESIAPPSRASVSFGSLADAGRRVAQLLAFAVVPLAVAVTILAFAAGDDYAFDFRQSWQAGRDVLHGVSPYPMSGELERVADPASLDAHGIRDVFRFPYPAPVAVATVPLSTLGFAAAAAIFTLLAVGAIALALAVLGVRDWRCYGVAFGSLATISAIRLGTLTPLLVLALALVWRYRDRPRVSAPALAAAIAAKLFLWPLVVWLIATRRFKASLLTTALTGGLLLAGWAVIGFAGLSEYPQLLDTLTEAVQTRGYSLVALGASLDVSVGTARVVAAVIALAALTAAVAFGRRRNGDLPTFSLALGGALALTPIVWVHYFTLLLVPIAIARPRFSALWLLPMAYWISPFSLGPASSGTVEAWRIGFALAVAVATLGLAALPSRRPARLSPAPTA
jgi:hypothetical protein